MPVPLVSICCLTYNHEPYIRQCLDGFIQQKTNFPIEVLIHDDASQDRTNDIIREYESLYPELIKPIYQTENQFSKGIGVTRVFQFPRAKGKYIAMCEGDDYWIDPLKLQKQVDFLEANNDFVFSGHAVDIKNEYENSIIGRYQPVKDIILLKDTVLGPPLHTSSLIFRNGILTVPKSTYKLPAGDDALECLLASKGKGYAFSEAMSVYRISSAGSWSTLNQVEKDYKTLIIQLWILGKYPKRLIQQTGRIYSLVISIYKQKKLFFKSLSVMNTTKVTLSILFYVFYSLASRIKRKIFNND